MKEVAFLSSAETVRVSRHFTNGLEAKSLDLTCEGTFPVSWEVAICFNPIRPPESTFSYKVIRAHPNLVVPILALGSS